MSPPKLYRVVYLEIEWLTDTCEGGEHVQRSGIYYVPARLVISEGVRLWQILDLNFNDPYFECDDLEYDWYSHDLRLAKVVEKYKHDPQLSRMYQTIKQKKEEENERKKLNKWIESIGF